MSLPPVAAAVTAAAVAALPARLRARLDAGVEQARDWPVERSGTVVTVRPDEQTVVTLTTPVAAPGDAVCSCLLAPRCLHRAAVLCAAPVLTALPEPTAAIPEPSSDSAVASREPSPGPDPGDRSSPDSAVGADDSLLDPAGAGRGSLPDSAVVSRGHDPELRRPARVSEAQGAAARGLWSAASAVLASGVAGAGAVAQADLLRAVHEARATGLHTAAAAAVRVVEYLRAARREDPGFRLAELADELGDLFGFCHRLAAGDASAVGVSRRDYESVGDLRLYGLFCEPVRAATGHAGAVTYLADAKGRVWVVSDVKPADAAVARSAARASVDLGEVRLGHHELSRGGLRAINAHASAAGRLSHGRARQAVAAPGAGWFDAPVAALWQAGTAEQVDRWLAAATLPPHERPAAHDLAFLDGVVLGADRRGLLLAVERHRLTVAVTAPHEDPSLPYVANLRLLAAHATGHPVRVVGRFAGPRRIDGLAFAAPWLPARHGGHVDLGTTPLTRADLPGAVPPPEPAGRESPAPPLHLVSHQLERVVSAGRAALLSGVDDDARRLTAAHLGTAAAVLTGLGAAGVRRTRDVFGRLDPHDADRLARAWLVAAVYVRAATRETTRMAWTTMTEERSWIG